MAFHLSGLSFLGVGAALIEPLGGIGDFVEPEADPSRFIGH